MKIKKIDHESTKIRRHESLNVVLFRAFNLSCFRDCVSEFSAGKNAKIITKILIGIKKSGKAGVSFVEKRGDFRGVVHAFRSFLLVTVLGGTEKNE